MAEADNTLAGLVQMNDQNLADLQVTDLLQDAPLLQVLFAQAASQGGTLHKYTKETVAAGAAFRAVNTGLLNTAPQEELVTVTCKFLDGHFHRDVAIALGYKDGPGAYMAKETRKELKALFASLEKQIFQSTDNDANGFTGFIGCTAVDAIADRMVIDAGGSGGESVWLIRSGENDVSVIAGNDGNLDFNYDPDQAPQKIITDASTGAGYMAHVVNLAGWFAMQFGSIYSLGRIANCDGTAGNVVTDALIAEALSKFPATRKPTHIAMSQTKQFELQNSRTATNPTGKEAPFPTEVFGIPIVTSDQVGTSETALTTA